MAAAPGAPCSTTDRWIGHVARARAREVTRKRHQGGRVPMAAPSKPSDGAKALSWSVSAGIGAIAGATSKTVTAPVERVRLLLQMSSKATASSSATAGAVLRTEGASGLWRGNGLAVARAMVQKGLLFATQDSLRGMLG